MIVVGQVLEAKERGVIGGQRGRKPHVVVHLDVEGGFEGMRDRRMGVIEVAEIRGVNGRARKEGGWGRRGCLRGIYDDRG